MWKQKESNFLSTNCPHPGPVARSPFHHGWNGRSDVERGSHRVFGKTRIGQVKIRANSAVPERKDRVLNPCPHCMPPNICKEDGYRDPVNWARVESGFLKPRWLISLCLGFMNDWNVTLVSFFVFGLEDILSIWYYWLLLLMTLVFWYFGKKYLFGVLYDSFILQRVIYVGRVIHFINDIRNLVCFLL